jgi:hypothetical protein
MPLEARLSVGSWLITIVLPDSKTVKRIVIRAVRPLIPSVRRIVSALIQNLSLSQKRSIIYKISALVGWSQRFLGPFLAFVTPRQWGVMFHGYPLHGAVVLERQRPWGRALMLEFALLIFLNPPNPYKEPLPVPGRSGWPSPACRAGSRICGVSASP